MSMISVIEHICQIVLSIASIMIIGIYIYRQWKAHIYWKVIVTLLVIACDGVVVLALKKLSPAVCSLIYIVSFFILLVIIAYKPMKSSSRGDTDYLKADNDSNTNS